MNKYMGCSVTVPSKAISNENFIRPVQKFSKLSGMTWGPGDQGYEK